ncbi:hypothetical protein [Pediococcus acidilactici]|uniref:hypothetical protein n=1 Tax=Pediococcus acidilactici TaxID=1254 RepID=UPI00133003C4|nr:hypothetical protein [Pediococcus acidilactici]KAF0378048.1 hypothetical protein GBO61_09725 [Pediococcus acidilactici]KAF0437043.1 hypothetical protein GBO91_10015 [Pediococcus acidilactici]KAF0541482.1 hypothetical protein GBP41_09950 [Pediococcus acidilactici]KAF0548773.1 hypothetical protein GBP43_09685 [Pediococcus acidilactici]
MKVNLSDIRNILKYGSIKNVELPNGNYIEKFVEKGQFYYGEYKNRTDLDVLIDNEKLSTSKNVIQILVRSSDLFNDDDDTTRVMINGEMYKIIKIDKNINDSNVNTFDLVSLELVK